MAEPETPVVGAPAAPVITVNSSATHGLVLSAITGGLRILGGALVTHGVVTQDQVNAAVDPLAQEILGFALAAIGQAWAWYRVAHAKSKLVEAARALPNQIQIK